MAEKDKIMDESEFEGTLVLEKLAAIDSETIAIVLKKMHQATGEH